MGHKAKQCHRIGTPERTTMTMTSTDHCFKKSLVGEGARGHDYKSGAPSVRPHKPRRAAGWQRGELGVEHLGSFEVRCPPPRLKQ